MTEAFCPGCGAQRVAGAAFCASCGRGVAAAAPDLSRSVASVALELERLRLRLIPFRLAGLAVGAAVGWVAAGLLTQDAALLQVCGAMFAALPGVWLGNIAGLAAVRG